MHLFSAILGQLATIISEEAGQQVKLVTGVEKEINKLKSKFESIQASLHDAEERQIKDRSIQNWLTKLKDVITWRMCESKSWEQLNQGFKPAASGSRILVTTRKDTVVKTMNSVRKFPLKELSDSVCWNIISQEAFVGRDEEECKSLESIGKKIAERCSGLPLVAKTLGGMLRFNKTRDDWKNILNSEIWQLDLVQKEVYVPLLLSFYDLPSAWMAQDYLGSDENAEMEIRGAEYFDCLVERSFFQDLEVFEDGSMWGCKIHDITVHFATFFMGNEVVSEDLHCDGKLSLEKTRHLLVRQMPGTSFPMLLAAEK
ncbi:hypothetical protein SLEP1_g18990 [Rubroshorea leprosula]|nr:hypothetical protein SLEP1_g18990 [Rubroshorea leprosula]